ncbi:MAG: peptidoglycan-binding domain-containing protein, partial [Myxococcales bacterium]
MGTVRDLTRRLAADHRITADEAKRLVDAVKADGNVSAEEKAELNQALARFQDAFDAPAWKLMQDNARGLGVAVSDRSPVSLNNRPELADIAAGRKALSSTSNRKDPAVATVQRALMTLARLDNRPELGLAGAGADGDYGAETANAVKAFQAYAGLKADGVLGKQTLAKLAEAVARVTRPQPQPETTPAEPLKNARFKGEPVLEKVAKGELTLANGARGEAVKRLQTALMDLGYTLPQFGADGGFGGESRRALEQFQKDRGLAVSGRLDAATLRKLDEVSPAPGANAVLYPEYDQMFKDGVLDVTLGLGYDEVGSDLAERRKLLTGLRSRGFESLDV